MLNVTSCNYESREIIALGNFPTNFLLVVQTRENSESKEYPYIMFYTDLIHIVKLKKSKVGKY